MRVLTVFNYEDFVKVVREYNADKIVGVCQNKRGLGNSFVEVEVRASASSKDVILELVYYRIVESEVFLKDRAEELINKAKELKGKLEQDGFEVVDGYWHDNSS